MRRQGASVLARAIADPLRVALEEQLRVAVPEHARDPLRALPGLEGVAGEAMPRLVDRAPPQRGRLERRHPHARPQGVQIEERALRPGPHIVLPGDRRALAVPEALGGLLRALRLGARPESAAVSPRNAEPGARNEWENGVGWDVLLSKRDPHLDKRLSAEAAKHVAVVRDAERP